MKADLSHLDRWRTAYGKYASPLGAPYGAFRIPHGNLIFMIIASGAYEDNGGWDHVSVHLRRKERPDEPLKRTPTWDEMCLVKSWFWEPSECVIQYHPPESDYVNVHQFVLHLWKHPDIKMPPKFFV